MTRRGAAPRAAWSLACVALAGGCEVALGLGGLHEVGSGSEAGGGGDGGTLDSTSGDGSQTGEATPEATSDAPSDSPASGEAAIVDAGASPCTVADAHTLCEDFDDIDAATDLDARWIVQQLVGGSLTVANGPVVSPPHSLAIELDVLDGSPGIEELDRTLSQASISGLHCEEDLWAQSIDLGSSIYIQLMGVVFHGLSGDPVSGVGFNLELGSDHILNAVSGVDYADGAAIYPQGQLGSIPLQRWIHLAFQFARPTDGGKNVTASFTYGDASAATSFEMDMPSVINLGSFELGMRGTGEPTSGWLIYIDNFFCDLAP